MTTATEIAMLLDDVTERSVAVMAGTHEQGLIVRRGLVESGTLTAVRTDAIELELRERVFGRPRITLDNPYLVDGDAEHLQAPGLVKAGTRATADMIAISALEPAITRDSKAPAGQQWVRDRSVRFAPAHEGFVVRHVEHHDARTSKRKLQRGVVETARIEMQRHDPLTVGDLLRIGDEDLPVVEIRDDLRMPVDPSGEPADMLLPASRWSAGKQAALVSRLLPSAEDRSLFADHTAAAWKGLARPNRCARSDCLATRQRFVCDCQRVGQSQVR